MSKQSLDLYKANAAVPESSRRLNRMVLIGSPQWVQGMIRRLHMSGVAEVGHWSKAEPTQNQDEVISVLVRLRQK